MLSRSAPDPDGEQPNWTLQGSVSLPANPDRDLWPIWTALWGGSILRVAAALASHEIFGAEATLALAAALLVPGSLLWHRVSKAMTGPTHPMPSFGTALETEGRHEVSMNIAYFLVPKSDVVWVSASGSLAQAIERMRPHGFGAVPILDAEGGYVGTLTEGDILWHLLSAAGAWLRVAKETPVLAVRRRTNHAVVHIDADIETLVAHATNQNFVPVVDDREVFIGIVPRKSIILHSAKAGRFRAPRHEASAGAAEPAFRRH